MEKTVFLMLHSKTIGFVIKHDKFGMIFAPPHFRNNASDILAKDIFGQEHVDINVSFAKNMEDIWEFAQNHRESTNMDIYIIYIYIYIEIEELFRWLHP